MKEQVEFDRLSVLAAALLLAMALARFLEAPARPLLRATVLGSPLGFNLSATSLIYLLIFGLTVTAIASLIATHPIAQGQAVNYSFMYWLMPAMLNVGLSTWLGRIDAQGAWQVVLLACAVLVPFALIVEYRSVDPQLRTTAAFRRNHTALIHLTAGILFTLNYDARARSLLSGTIIVLVASLLAARLLWNYVDSLSTAILYGAVVGVIMGQATWGLNYWRLSGVQGGIVLLLLFYVLLGVVQNAIRGLLNSWESGSGVLVEYAAISLVTLLVILLAAP